MRLPSDLDVLLRRAASRSATPADLAALRARRNDVIETMEGENEDPAWLSETTPEALQRAYQELFLDDNEEEASDYGVHPFQFQEVAAGRWFMRVLVPALGDLDLAAMFAGLPRLEPDVVEFVMGEPSVVEGGPVASALAPYGITPMEIASTGRQLSNLAARLLHDAPDAPSVVIDLEAARVCAISEPNLAPAVADRLAEFLLVAAKACPGVISGFVVESGPDGLVLRRDDSVRGWSTPEDDRTIPSPS